METFLGGIMILLLAGAMLWTLSFVFFGMIWILFEVVQFLIKD